jgi:TPR repeat protein
MQRIKFHAESKDWAQYEMSDHCLRRSDIPQAVKWLEKAAALGHTMARGRLGEMCQNRGLDVKAHGYMLPAARSGHVAAQFFCAEYAQKRLAVGLWRKPSRGACWPPDKGFRPHSA